MSKNYITLTQTNALDELREYNHLYWSELLPANKSRGYFENRVIGIENFVKLAAQYDCAFIIDGTGIHYLDSAAQDCADNSLTEGLKEAVTEIHKLNEPEQKRDLAYWVGLTGAVGLGGAIGAFTVRVLSSFL